MPLFDTGTPTRGALASCYSQLLLPHLQSIAEAGLRDAWCFRATGDDPGPSGQILPTGCQLAQRDSGWPAKLITQVAKALDLDLDDRAGEFVTLLESRAKVEGSPLAVVTSSTKGSSPAWPRRKRGAENWGGRLVSVQSPAASHRRFSICWLPVSCTAPCVRHLC